MKITANIIITVILLAGCICGYAQTAEEKKTLEQINQTVLALYRGQNFDGAEKNARQAFDLTIKIFGTESRETVAAYTNLGLIYRAKGEFKSSIENLEKALEIYLKIPDLDVNRLIDAYEVLAYTQQLSGREDEAATNYLKAIDVAARKFGRESKESFPVMLDLANLYARRKKYGEANQYYLKSYSLVAKNFGRDSKEYESIEDARICLVDDEEVDKTERKAFNKAVDELFDTKIGKNLDVVNGKAKILPKPVYPSAAQKLRLDGKVIIKVKIDKQGKVAEAKVVCGHPILARSAENAAWGAQFESTLEDGKPVEVTGYIVYKFVDRR